MATIGEQLLSPEAGWKRIDDNDKRVYYTGGNWHSYSGNQGTGHYNSTYHSNQIYGSSAQVSTIGYKITIYAYTSKIRLIGFGSSWTCKSINVKIDESVISNFKTNYGDTNGIGSCLFFEKNDMEKAIHKIEFETNDLCQTVIDCIDIDADGYLIDIPRKFGDILTSPDAGWKRIDDMNSNVIYKGNDWVVTKTDANTYLGTSHYCPVNVVNNTITFKFYGTKLRLIDLLFSNRVNIVNVTIDDQTEKYNPCDSRNIYQVMVYEKTGLTQGIHTVTLSTTASSGTFSLDAIDIDEDGYIVTQVGNQLATPEPGWKRINDNDKLIKYGVGWGVGLAHSSCYNNTFSQCQGSNSENSKVVMYMYSDKLRIVGLNYISYSSNISVTINDNEVEKFSAQGNSTYQALLYDKKFKSKYNKVELQMKDVSALGFVIECIDIDKDGYLMTEEEYRILTSKKYLIKDNSTYKTIVNNELVTIENATAEFNKEYPDNTCITNLNEVIKFIPQLTKGWKIISNENFNSIVTAIETNQQLVLANGDFSVKLANNIDYFTSTSTITNTSSIKIVLSTDSGLNWYTTNNNGTSWAKISCTPPLKKYTELSSEEIIAWNNFKDEVFTNGINIKDLRNINFNTLKCEKIRFAYVLNTNAADDVNIIKSLEWQFDSIGSYDQMNKDSVKISITNNSIKVTPLKNVDLMKINVGISSNEQQELDTSGLLDKKTFLGKEINSVKKADFATSLDVADQLNGSILYYGTNNNDSELKMRQFPAGTHTEHIDSYNFENLTKGIPQAINFVKEIPDVNCFAEALQYVHGESNLETIFEKYSNDNITIKTNNLKVDESGISINKSYNLSCKLNSDNLYESEIINKDNFFEITGMEAE